MVLLVRLHHRNSAGGNNFSKKPTLCLGLFEKVGSHTLPETTTASLHLKMMGFPSSESPNFQGGYFQVQAVSFREGNPLSIKMFLGFVCFWVVMSFFVQSPWTTHHVGFFYLVHGFQASWPSSSAKGHGLARGSGPPTSHNMGGGRR